jgi:monoamine oxidase
MARSPLFRFFRDAARQAMMAETVGARLPTGEPGEGNRLGRVNRRGFLHKSLGGLALGGLLAGRPSSAKASSLARSDPRVIIVGAGLAGLVAAHRLAKAGVRAGIYEASLRLGGRVKTLVGAVAPGLPSELGGEFIADDHFETIALVKELHAGIVDTWQVAEPRRSRITFFFEGQHYAEPQVVDALRPIVARVIDDRKRLRALGTDRQLEATEAQDRTSIAQYLDGLGISGWARRLVDVTWSTEFGLDPGDQSSLNLINEIQRPEIGSLYPLSDERYRVDGGAERLIDRLGQKLAGQVQHEHRLEAIESRGGALTLTFAGPNGTPVDVSADVALICIPFSTLRDVTIRVDLPPSKRKAIAELGYGTCTKLVLGFERHVWRDLGYSGRIITDLPLETAWDSGRANGDGPAVLTVFNGGGRGVHLESGPVEERAKPLLSALDTAYKGCSSAHTGKTVRSGWVTNPLFRGSYACYRPGQWTSIAGTEGEAAGPLLFAGEHCGGDSQGYMNGAVRSGSMAAKAILQKIGKA